MNFTAKTSVLCFRSRVFLSQTLKFSLIQNQNGTRLVCCLGAQARAVRGLLLQSVRRQGRAGQQEAGSGHR